MNKLAFLIFLLAFVACQSNIGVQEAPKNLISKEKIKNVLYDISILESAINARYGQLSKHHKITKASIENYLKQAEIDSNAFKASLNYYHGSFDEGISLYDMILDSLTLSTKQLNP